MTDDEAIYNKARVLSCHGMSAGAWNRYGKGGAWGYDIEEPGFKYNMFDIQAALALVQRARMDDMQRRRFACVQVYEEAFRDVPELILQKTPAYCGHSRHLYILRIDESRLTITRDQFIEELKKRGIDNVTVAQTGCVGMCRLEPIVEVYVKDQEKVTYVHMTPEKVARVVNDHIVNGRPVEEYTIGAQG